MNIEKLFNWLFAVCWFIATIGSAITISATVMQLGKVDPNVAYVCSTLIALYISHKFNP